MDSPQIQLLLVEDDPNDALLVQSELSRDESRRWFVTHVRSLREACDRLKQQHFQVALLDLGLPDSSGLKTFQALRETSKNLSVLVLSGATDDDVAAKAVKEGAVDYLVKGAANRPLPYALDRWRFEWMTAAHSGEQFAVAALGQHAISGADLDSVFSEAVTLIRETLSVDGCSILQWAPAPGDAHLISRACAGAVMDPFQAFPRNTTSDTRELLQSAEPLFFQRDAATSAAPNADLFNVGLSVPIAERGRAWGVLTLHTLKQRAFLQHEVNFLRTVAHLLSEVIERKNGEAALRASEAAMAVAQRIAHFGSWELDLDKDPRVDSNPLRWSDEMFRIAGYEPGAVNVNNDLFFSLVPEEEHPQIRAAIRKTIEDGTPYSITHRIVRPTGEERIVRELAQLFLDEQTEQPSKVIGTAHDITDQVKAEESIHFQAHVLDQIGQAVIAIDLKGQIVYSNRFAGQLYGWTATEFLGANLLDLIISPASRKTATEQLLARDGAESREADIFVQRRDGSTFPARFVSSPLFSRTGSLDGVITVSTDISAAKAAEQQLQSSQRMLKIASRLTRLGAWQVDVQAMRLTWSDEVRAIHEAALDFQPTVEEALNFYTPESQPQITRAIQNCISAGEPFDLELQIMSAKGRLLWVRSIGEGVSENGVVIRVRGAFQDITEAKQAELSIRQSEERFRLFSKATNDAIWDWNLAEDTHWWNEGFETLFGFSRAEIEPGVDSWINRIHPEDRERVLGGIYTSLQSLETSWTTEYRFLRKDGTYAYVLDRGYFIRDLSGKASRMIGGMTDLSERRQAEERIAQQAALLNIAHDAILVKDLTGKILFWNQGAQRIYGWTAAEAIGQNSSQLLHRSESKFDDALASLLKDGEWQGEMGKRSKDGRDLVVQVRWTLVMDPAGNPKSILAINTDITEKKKFEAQFFRAQRMESIGTLAGGIAHDLNNVLAPILMALEMLHDSAANAEGRALVSILQASAQRGADLVKQVLSFARGVEGERVSVNLVLVLREIEKITREAFPKNIEFRLHVEKDLWTVTGDPTQLHQVFMNLCVNARDAMPLGGQLAIEVKNVLLDEIYCELTPDSKPGSYVLVSVQDTGVGIPLELREKVFEPFFTTKEVGRGTGLGLSTTLSLVKAHGGFVHLYSEVGKGSRFKIYLPATRSGHEILLAPLGDTQLPRGNGERILLADDEEAVRTVAKQTLERFGYRVVVAANGAQAVATYAQNRDDVSLVITDMAMPIMDGPATIIALRALDPTLKIIGSSGVASNGGVAKALSAGVHHFIAKPYTAQTLLKAVHEVLTTAP